MVPSNLPGAPLVPEALPTRLLQALAARGPGYRPRTHHFLPDGKTPRFINRLVLEPSPYLLQHAHNPVNWQPWGDDAFAEATSRGVPVFLSIGYSTCHWCHVMEAESFEDEQIAAYLNQHYVCIKVDREERPDVDAVYMTAVQAATGAGGWPMSVFLTPDREPFFAGTYFPPRDGARGARMGFLSILQQLASKWSTDQARMKEAARSLTAAVRNEMERPPGGPGAPPDRALIDTTIEHYKRVFDRVSGGLRRAPKFPSSLPIRLLLRHHRRTRDPETLAMATLTLTKMAAGGMYDQLGGGFHRYSVDDRWLVPHFEKMLYDNALLAVAYSEAHQLTGRADFARVAREILDYVLGEMTAPEGGFYSATDADSEGEEGRFFVWSLDEIRTVLGSEAARFIQHYGVTAAGNFEGHNILAVATPSEDEHAALASARRKLYQVRAQRVPPLRDEKILAAWNGLMISALAVGARVLGEPRYADAAARAAEFLLTTLRRGDRMGRSYKDGHVQSPGFLEDHVFVAAGCLDLFEATSDPRWLKEALALATTTETHFADPEHGGWFMSARDGERLLAREKPSYDGAEPSGTSIAILNALRLSSFTSDDTWRAVAERALGALREQLADRALGMTEALLALDFYLDRVGEVVIVWPPGAAAAAGDLLGVLRATFVPGKVAVTAEEGPAMTALAALVPFAEGKRALEGRPTAYVCERGRCELPTHDPAVFASQLNKLRPA